jgi:hypothetical protein
MAVASLPLAGYGLWLPFAGGLACGTGAAALGFFSAYKFMERAIATGSRGSAFAGIGLRLFIYLAAMASMTMAFGLWAGLGSAAGCLTAPVSIIICNVAVPRFRARAGGPSGEDDTRYIYEPHMRDAYGDLRYVFMRGTYMERASGGRIYMTHRRFRKLAAVRRAGKETR